MKKHAIISENGFAIYTESLGIIQVSNSTPRYGMLLQALLNEDYDEKKFLDLLKSTVKVDLAELSAGELTRSDTGDSYIFKDGEDSLIVPQDIYNKMTELAQKGASYDHIRNFWRRCQCNPRKESIRQLFAFVSRHLLTITDEGLFVAYKAVRSNYYDKHSGTYDNHPGLVVEMARDKVTFDPNTHCAPGLHVSNYEYAHGFAGGDDRIVVCLVDPADVVSVPNDCSAQKIRVCKYLVQSDYTPDYAFDDVSVVDSGLNQVSDLSGLNVNRPWTASEDDALIKFMFDCDEDVDDLNYVDVAKLANTLGRTTDGVYARLAKIENEEDPRASFSSYDEYIEETMGDIDEDDCEPICGNCCGCCDCDEDAERESLREAIIRYVYRNHMENSWSSFSTIKAISEEFEISPEAAHELLTELNDAELIADHCDADSYLNALRKSDNEPTTPVKEPWETVTSSVMDEEQLRFLYEQVGIFGYNWKVIQSKMTKAFPDRAVVHEDTLRKTAKRMGL